MFNLYFAGSYSPAEDLMRELNCKRLFSQFNDRSGVKKWIEDWDKTGKRHIIFIDSGAYTARTKGIEIDLDKYIEYLNENKGRFEVIAPLDVIPNESKESQLDAPEKSWQNYLIMKERVIDSDKVIPAFHMGEDYKYLQQILDSNVEYMAMGGMAGRTAKARINWYEKCFRIIQQSKNPNIKIHAFGMTSLKLLETYPFYSADSTSWIMYAVTGNIFTDNGALYVGSDYNNPNHLKYQNKLVQDRIIGQCKEYGLDYNKLVEDYKERQKYNVFYLQNWADNYTFKGTKRYRRTLF